jgi:hypothetical protein
MRAARDSVSAGPGRLQTKGLKKRCTRIHTLRRVKPQHIKEIHTRRKVDLNQERKVNHTLICLCLDFITPSAHCNFQLEILTHFRRSESGEEVFRQDQSSGAADLFLPHDRRIPRFFGD